MAENNGGDGWGGILLGIFGGLFIASVVPVVGPVVGGLAVLCGIALAIGKML